MVSGVNWGASEVDAQKLTEDFKRPLTPAHTLPVQNSSEKPIESKSHSPKEWESFPSSSQSRRGFAFEESDDFEQKALKWPNSLHYKNKNEKYYQLAWLAGKGETIK